MKSLFDNENPSWMQQRDESLTAVMANVQGQTPGFAQDAADFVLRYLATHEEATGEQLSDAAKAAGIVPSTTDKAFGGVYRSLSHRGLIEKCGLAVRTKGHGTSGGNIWRLKK